MIQFLDDIWGVFLQSLNLLIKHMSRVIKKVAGKRDPLNFMWNKNPASESELGGGFQYFWFSPLFGKDFQFDEHIFQMGWKKPPTIESQQETQLTKLSTLGIRSAEPWNLNDRAAFRVSVIGSTPIISWEYDDWCLGAIFSWTFDTGLLWCWKGAKELHCWH